MAKNILLVSSNPIRNDTNIGKTYLSMFKNFDKENLSSLYMHPSLPNEMITKSNYQICEMQLINSFLGLNQKKCGKIIDTIDSRKNELIVNNPSRFRSKNNIFISYLREMLWSFSFYKNKKMKNWIKEQNPSIIFSILFDTNYTIKFLTWLKKFTKAPLVLFVTDDYYNDYFHKRNIFRRYFFYRKRKLLDKLHVDYVVGCSDFATEYFKKVLKVKKGQTIYTSCLQNYLDMPIKSQNNDSIIKLRYFGNLGLKRNETLEKIGHALQNLNKEGMKAILEIYSSVTDISITSKLNIINGSIFKGWISGQNYLNALQDADIAVHVESFDEDVVKRTYYSISTKIADYLGAGKCILAIGPSKIASIDHISDCSFVIDDTSKIEEKLLDLINNYHLRNDLSTKARNKALLNHDEKTINKQLTDIFNEL